MSTQPKHTHRIAIPDVHDALPHSLEAEKGLLGSVVITPETLTLDVVLTVRAADFYLPAHQTVFQLLVDRWTANQPADVITLTQALRDHGQLDAVGGPAFVTELFTYVPTAANAEFYAETIIAKARLRAIIGRCGTAAALAYEAGAEADAIMAEEIAPLADALTAATGRPAPTMADLEDAAVDRYERAATGQRLEAEKPVATGFDALDELLDGGLRPGQLVVLAAETSGGKSALALNLAEHMTVRAAVPLPCLFLSYEMSARELVDRLNASLARVPLGTLLSGKITEAEFARLSPALLRAKSAPLFVRDDCGGWTVADICAQARAHAIRHGRGLLVVDYVQQVPATPNAAKNERRDQQVAEVTRRLKGLALELGLIVVVLSQLNDEGRLRESRAIGHDGDVILKLTWGTDKAGEPDPEAVELRVEKNRNGRRGLVALRFNGALCRFEPRHR